MIPYGGGEGQTLAPVSFHSGRDRAKKRNSKHKSTTFVQLDHRGSWIMILLSCTPAYLDPT